MIDEIILSIALVLLTISIILLVYCCWYGFDIKQRFMVRDKSMLMYVRRSVQLNCGFIRSRILERRSIRNSANGEMTTML